MLVGGSIFDAAELLVLGGLISLVTVLAFLAFVITAGKDPREGAEPRGQAIYLHLVLLISMFVGLIAATTVVASLSQLIGTNTPTSLLPVGTTGSGSGATGVTGIGSLLPLAPPSLHPVGDAAARGAVAGGILLLVAGGLFLAHWRQGRRFREDAVLRATNAGRILQAYLNTATLVAVLVLIVSASLAGYAVFEAAAPGVAAASGHVAPLRGLVPLLFFTGADLLIIDRHWRVMRPLRGAPMPPSAFPPPPGDAGNAAPATVAPAWAAESPPPSPPPAET